ncbi:g2038 [Coccomyxa elongata]
MPKDINPFRGKRTLGNSNKAPRRSRKRNSKGSGKNSGKNSWGLLGLAVSITAAWLFGAWQIGEHRTKKKQYDKLTLAGLLSKPLKYTEHALCRMDCRHIPEKEVVATLNEGTVNDRKSNMRQFPCPKYVVDATLQVGVKAKKSVQAVFSACPTQTDVITVIDKDTDWECYCP